MSKKASLIYIIEILKDYTDENHFLTHQEIVEKIDQIYGVRYERKSIGSSLALLKELGLDINVAPGGGVALFSRLFDKSEIAYLIDAVFSSKVINGAQAQSIIKGLNSCLSINDRKEYPFLSKAVDITRTANKELFFTIEVITDAIKRNKMVGFNYLEYNECGNLKDRMNSYIHHVSPYFLVNNIGKYYLLGNKRRYNNMTVYRLDFIANVHVLEDRDIKPLSEIEDMGKNFSITNYINDHVYIFGGDVTTFKIKLKNESAFTPIFDSFGKNSRIIKCEDEYFATIKCNEKAFFYWAIQYLNLVEVIEPQYMRHQIKEVLEGALKRYNL